MKILLLGPAHPLRGGIAQFNERLASQFQAEGHHVVIYSFSRQYPNFLFPGKTQLDDGPAPAGLDIRTVVDSINPINWWRTARAMANQQPDLIIVRYWLPFMAPCLGSIIGLIRRWKPLPVVAITDNVIPHEPRFADRAFTQFFLNRCDAFVAMSGTVMSELKQFVPNAKAALIHHPIYDHFGAALSKVDARKKLGLPEGGKLVVFFGLVRHYKGLDLLIDALADPCLSDVNLLVAGEVYGDSKPYTDQIQLHSLSNRVTLLNQFIPNDLVAAVFCSADVVVQPYRTASQSGVTQVAYHFATPMIVTNVGGLPEMVTHGRGVLICEPGAGSIANALNQFYADGLEASFSQMLVEERNRFAWTTMTQGILQLAQHP